MSKKYLNVGVIGCGMISDWYFRAAKRFKQIRIVGCADLKHVLAEKQGAEYQIPVRTPEEIYNDPQVDVILNLTPPKAHCAVLKRALEAGKHAYTEKPLGVDLDEAREVLELAREKNLYLGCAPDTFLGGGHQTMRKLLDDNWIGKPLAGTVVCLGRGPEKWEHAPAFYTKGAGPMLDIGPYFISQLINLLGPAKYVTAAVTRGADRRAGGDDTVPRIYPVTVPTHQSGIIEFASGVQITMINSYEVFAPSRHPFIELYGSRGALAMFHPNYFGGKVEVFQDGYEDWKEVPPAFIYNSDARSIGLADMIESILTGKPARASGDLAYHALEIMLGFEKSAESGCRIELKSTCSRPEAMLPVMDDGCINTISLLDE
ncbi:MAG: Gfo/Idh/MocA family oxidoreductase [Lentisphaerae bacterium]|nr:Gfo/Idh/MocA family oxidoreductase [Lentisphaerota bacterium]